MIFLILTVAVPYFAASYIVTFVYSLIVHERMENLWYVPYGVELTGKIIGVLCSVIALLAVTAIMETGSGIRGA